VWGKLQKRKRGQAREGGREDISLARARSVSRSLAYPGPVVPHPESLAAQAAYTEAAALAISRVQLGPESFPGIGVLPAPDTGSHIVNSGTPVTAAAECPEREREREREVY
jgi:hypothetical protein